MFPAFFIVKKTRLFYKQAIFFKFLKGSIMAISPHSSYWRAITALVKSGVIAPEEEAFFKFNEVAKIYFACGAELTKRARVQDQIALDIQNEAARRHKFTQADIKHAITALQQSARLSYAAAYCFDAGLELQDKSSREIAYQDFMTTLVSNKTSRKPQDAFTISTFNGPVDIMEVVLDCLPKRMRGLFGKAAPAVPPGAA